MGPQEHREHSFPQRSNGPHITPLPSPFTHATDPRVSQFCFETFQYQRLNRCENGLGDGFYYRPGSSRERCSFLGLPVRDMQEGGFFYGSFVFRMEDRPV